MAAPAIGKRRRWTPPVTAKVDRSHPIAANLVAAYLPIPGTGAIDLARSENLALLGAPTRGATPFGNGMVNVAGNDGASNVIGSTDPMSLQPPITLMWVGTFQSAPAANAAIFGCSSSNADLPPYHAYMIIVNASSNAGAFANDSGVNVQTGYTTITLGVPHVYIATFTPAALTFYADGVATTPGAAVSVITYTATSTLGFNYYPTARATNSTANFGAIWNRELSASEISALTADPFQMLRW